MADFALIDQHKYLFLEELVEPRECDLRLVVAEGRAHRSTITAAGPVTEVWPIVADERSARYELVFRNYIVYSVRNESYAAVSAEEVYSGRLARIYTASKFLDFVRAGTFASPEYPGPFEHYGLVCQNHVIDVAAFIRPEVRCLS